MYFIAYKKNLPLEIRSKFSLVNKKFPQYYEKLKENFKESIIINTCNRTELYISVKDHSNLSKDNIIDIVFNIFNWDITLKEYILLQDEESTIRHLLEVACGFHSKILGEDQILSQIKDSLKLAKENNMSGKLLQRLFLEAIACGKKFRNNCSLNQIPVSISSIAAKKAINNGCNNIAVIGYGEIGKLTVKYLKEGKNIDNIYVVVRDLSKIKEAETGNVRFVDYSNKLEVFKDVQAIVSCTSAPHYVVKETEISKDKKYFIFDLAVPRDVEESLGERENINLYNVDNLSVIDYENKKLRQERINSNKYIVKEYIDEFKNWQKINKISPVLFAINSKKEELSKQRAKSFSNKKETKDIEKMNLMLLESMANNYVNKAIEVLKEETLKGRNEECLKILKKIFL